MSKGYNDSVHCLLQASLLPPAILLPQVSFSLASVQHGFIIYFTAILAWSILHSRTLPTPLIATSAKPVHLFHPQWGNRSDLKTVSIVKFSFKAKWSDTHFTTKEKQDYFLLSPFLSSDYHLYSKPLSQEKKIVPTQHLKSHPFLLDCFSYRVALWACSLRSQRNICTNIVQEVTQEQDSAIFGNDTIFGARQHTTASQISSLLGFTPHLLCRTGSYMGGTKKEIFLGNKKQGIE